MSDETCARVQERATELALDVLAGSERADVLAHVETCPRCRTVVSELAEVADLLVHLAPEIEPPRGFGARVTALMVSDDPAQTARLRRRRVVRALAVAAVAAVALAVVVLPAADDGAGRPSTAPVVAVRSAAMVGGGGLAVGWVTASGGRPATLEVAVDYALADGPYGLELAHGGRSHVLGTMVVAGGHGRWSGPTVLPAGPATVALLDGSGAIQCSAMLG